MPPLKLAESLDAKAVRRTADFRRVAGRVER